MVFTNLPPRSVQPPEITPFTYPDGITNMEILRHFKRWIEHIEKNVADALGSFGDDVNAELAALRDDVETALAAGKDYTDAEVAAMVAYVDTAVQQIINNSIEVQDPLVAEMFDDEQSLTRVKTDALYTPLPGELYVNALTGYVHLNNKIFNNSNTPNENAIVLQNAFDVAGDNGVVLLSPYMREETIEVECGVVEVTTRQATLLGSVARSEYTPRIKGVGNGYIIHAKNYGFNVQGVNFLGDGDSVNDGDTYTPTVDGILFDRSVGAVDPTLANLDGKVRDTGFMYMRTAVKAVGRNVDYVDNIVSNCVQGFDIAQYSNELCRGFRFNGNRFHSVGVRGGVHLQGVPSFCIRTPANSMGHHVINNYADMGTRDFYVGARNDSMFTDNLMFSVSGVAFTFTDGAASFAWVVSGNTYRGAVDTSMDGVRLAAQDSTPDHFILTSGSLDNGSITNNNVMGTRKDGIKSIGASNLTIMGNVITNAGFYYWLESLPYDGISLFGGGSNVVLQGNVIRSTSPGGTATMRFAINTSTISNVVSTGNRMLGHRDGPSYIAGSNAMVMEDNSLRMSPRATPGLPANALFVDSTDNKLKFRNQAGVIQEIAIV